jgi:hypothetical protein
MKFYFYTCDSIQVLSKFHASSLTLHEIPYFWMDTKPQTGGYTSVVF